MKKLFLCFYLQNRSIIIAEMIVSSLPQISSRLCNNLNFVICQRVIIRFSRLLKIFYIHLIIPPNLDCYNLFQLHNFLVLLIPVVLLPVIIRIIISAIIISSIEFLSPVIGEIIRIIIIINIIGIVSPG